MLTVCLVTRVQVNGKSNNLFAKEQSILRKVTHTWLKTPTSIFSNRSGVRSTNL